MKKALFLIVLFYIAGLKTGNAFSDTDTTISIGKFLKKDSVFSFCSKKGYVPSLFHAFGEQFVSPFHMKTRDWVWAFGVLSATSVLIHYDHDIDESVRYAKAKSNFVKATSPVVTEFGNQYGLGLTAVLGVTGLVTKNQKLFQASLMASQAAITSGIWVRIVKYMTSRERPSASYTYMSNKGHQGGYWYGFFKEYDTSVTSIGRDITYFDAFPSGHTSTAFAIASVFAMEYRDKPAIPVIAYTLAGVVGITRMTEHTHWASDVFVGAWAGYLCAKQVVHHHRKIFSTETVSSSTKKVKPALYVSTADYFAGFKLKMIF